MNAEVKQHNNKLQQVHLDDSLAFGALLIVIGYLSSVLERRLQSTDTKSFFHVPV